MLDVGRWDSPPNNFHTGRRGLPILQWYNWTQDIVRPRWFRLEHHLGGRMDDQTATERYYRTV
jgi:hypothetical protein